jgi:hypothetical protein
MEPGGEDPQREQPRRRPITTIVVAIITVVLLVAGAVVIALDDTEAPEDDLEADLVPPATTEPTAPATPSELEAVVTELSAFVADARDLEWKTPVDATLLDDEAFSARVREDAVDDLEELEEAEGVFRAFGLIDPGVDLAESLRSLLGAGVVGFYNPETGELVVRGSAITPYVRLVLVHELTHALEDQHFDIDRKDLDDRDDESGTGFVALTEGSALRVEDLYRETLTDEERAAAENEEARLSQGIDLASIPRSVAQVIGFPYIFGPGLLASLEEDGGNARIDEAFADPPITSEQVLDPDAWLDGDAAPVGIPPPPADGEVFDQGVIGQWGLYMILGEEVGDRAAVEAAGGWGGDWYVAWRRGEEVCVRATIVMDTADDLRELAGALDEWAAAHRDAEVARGEGDLTIAACA